MSILWKQWDSFPLRCPGSRSLCLHCVHAEVEEQQWQQLQPVELQDRSAMENLSLTCCLLAGGQTKLMSHQRAGASQESLMLTRWEKVSTLKIVALLQVMLWKDLLSYLRPVGNKDHAGEKHCFDGKWRKFRLNLIRLQCPCHCQHFVHHSTQPFNIFFRFILFCIELNFPSFMKYWF